MLLRLQRLNEARAAFSNSRMLFHSEGFAEQETGSGEGMERRAMCEGREVKTFLRNCFSLPLPPTPLLGLKKQKFLAP